jgi:filamentous hemagglutinin
MRLKLGTTGVLVIAAIVLLGAMLWFLLLRPSRELTFPPAEPTAPPAAAATTAPTRPAPSSTATAQAAASPVASTTTARPLAAATARPAATATSRPQASVTGEYVMRNQTIYALDGRVAYKGDVDVKPTLDRIAQGVKDPHSNDGAVFGNFERRLPVKTDRQYYREYVIRTPGLREVGPQRLILGKGGEVYYTPNHYDSFIQVK